MFKLLRYFSITSLVAFVAVILALALFSRQTAINDLMALGESKNVALTQAFINSLWPQFSTFVSTSSAASGDALQAHPDMLGLQEAVRAQMSGTTVVRLKVYNPAGLTVFSTQQDQIGEDKGSNAGFQEALAGKIETELEHKDGFSAFEGTVEDRDMISSYVPVRVGDTVEGVVELYDDVTPLLEQIETTQRTVIAGVVVILAVLYAVLFFIVQYAERVMKQQAFEREMAVKAHRESEVRLRTVVNSAPIMLWSVDKEGKLTLLEGSSLSALGINRERSIGQPLAEVYRNVPQIVNEVNRALADKEFGSLVTARDLTFDTRYTPVRGSDGTVNSVIGVATDITERMMAEEALGYTSDNLEHQNQRLKRVNEFFLATLEQGVATVQRGGTKVEILDLLQQAQTEFDRLA